MANLKALEANVTRLEADFRKVRDQIQALSYKQDKLRNKLVTQCIATENKLCDARNKLHSATKEAEYLENKRKRERQEAEERKLQAQADKRRAEERKKESAQRVRDAQDRFRAISRDPNHIHPNSAVGYKGWKTPKLNEGMQEGVGSMYESANQGADTYTNFVHQEIDGYTFIPHALKRMQERGVYASQVIQVIQTVTPTQYYHEKSATYRFKYKSWSDKIVVDTFVDSGHIIYVNRM